MKHFFKWLETKFRGPINSVAADRVSGTVSVEPGDMSTTSDAEMPDLLNTVGYGRDVSMPDIYADGDVVTEPDRKILQQPSADGDESAGFNPYDTGVLQKK